MESVPLLTVGDVEDFTRFDDVPEATALAQWPRERIAPLVPGSSPGLEACGEVNQIELCRVVNQITVESIQAAVHCAGKRHGISYDRVEDRLNVRRRTGDDTQNLSGRGQVAIALLQLREQPHILDRDNGLVGEGLEESYLALGERLSLSTSQNDRAGRNTFSHQGDAENRAEALAPGVLAGRGKLVPLGLDVSDVDGPPVQN